MSTGSNGLTGELWTRRTGPGQSQKEPGQWKGQPAGHTGSAPTWNKEQMIHLCQNPQELWGSLWEVPNSQKVCGVLQEVGEGGQGLSKDMHRVLGLLVRKWAERLNEGHLGGMIPWRASLEYLGTRSPQECCGMLTGARWLL